LLSATLTVLNVSDAVLHQFSLTGDLNIWLGRKDSMTVVGLPDAVTRARPPKNRTCASRRIRLKPLRRHLSTPGYATEFVGVLMIPTAIEMVHSKIARCLRPALGSFHNIANIPRGALCDWFLTGRTQAILP
jgi:hypothetical protein